MSILYDFIPKSLVLFFAILFGALLVKANWKNSDLTAQVADIKARYERSVTSAEANLRLRDQQYREQEQSMQSAMNLERKTLNEKANSLVVDRDALRVRLQQSIAAHAALGASAVSQIAGVAETPGVGNGTELPEPIGGLVDEAYRADQIRVELLGCYRAYDKARDTVGQ